MGVADAFARKGDERAEVLQDGLLNMGHAAKIGPGWGQGKPHIEAKFSVMIERVAR